MTPRRTDGSRGGRRRSPGLDDAGLASIELVVVLPAFVLLTLLPMFLGRRTIVQTSLDDAAHDAARAASIARTYPDAQTAATDAAAAALTAPDSEYAPGSVTVTIPAGGDGFTVPTGQPATVTVIVSCQVRNYWTCFR